MATTFCTKDDMETFLSLRGIIAFSDHEETGEANDMVIDKSRQRATDEIIGALYPVYLEDDLALSQLVTEWCTTLACFYLCKTRGNPVPDSIYEDYEAITKPVTGFLDRSKAGTFSIPRIRTQSTNYPAFSNLIIDRRFPREKVRVIQSNSSPIRTVIEQDTTTDITE